MEVMPIQWLQSMPPITRGYIIGSTLLSLCEFLGYVKTSDFLLNPNTPFSLKQLWPIFLNTLYNGSLSLDLCAKLYFFSRYSNWLETFVNSPKNYLWMIFILIIMINLYSKFITNLSFFGPVLKETFLCIWSRNHANDEVFFVLISLRACWVPWANFFIDISFNRDSKKLIPNIAGIIIGHLFWFLDEELPKLHGTQSFLRPIWQWNLFKNTLFNNNQQENLVELNNLDNIPENNDEQNEINEINEENEENLENPQNQDYNNLDYEEIINDPLETDFQRETDYTLIQRNQN